MRLHMVDVEGLLERVSAVAASPPADQSRGAPTDGPEENDKLTDDQSAAKERTAFKEIWQDQQQQMGELWHVEENLIAFLDSLVARTLLGARRVLFQWRSVRLAAHQAAILVWPG